MMVDRSTYLLQTRLHTRETLAKEEFEASSEKWLYLLGEVNEELRALYTAIHSLSLDTHPLHVSTWREKYGIHDHEQDDNVNLLNVVTHDERIQKAADIIEFESSTTALLAKTNLWRYCYKSMAATLLL